MTAAPARPLHLLEDGPHDGPTNMARDESLLHGQRWRPATLRLYQWDPPTLSLGCFQRIADLATLPPDVQQLAVVRRPTGGGAILHDRELTYALVLDDTVPLAHRSPIALYTLVHECWRDALAADGIRAELAPPHFPLPTPRTGPFFCFQKPGQTDLLIGPDKVLGSAQRRLPGRVLQHGSLILGRRYAAHPGAHLGEPPAERVAAWTARFVALLAGALELTPAAASWCSDDESDLAPRRAHYASDEWTRRR